MVVVVVVVRLLGLVLLLLRRRVWVPVGVILVRVLSKGLRELVVVVVVMAVVAMEEEEEEASNIARLSVPNPVMISMQMKENQETKVSQEALMGPQSPPPRAEYDFEKELDAGRTAKGSGMFNR